MNTLIRPNILNMAGYIPGEQLNDPDIIKLNTNENPYPPSPKVFSAIQEALQPNILRKYPQPFGDQFRQRASAILNVDPDSILIGNGSDDILTILTRACVPENGLMVSMTPSYILYESLAQIQGANFRSIPFIADWKLPGTWPEPNADLTLIANPNSPSGTMLTLNELETVAQSVAKTVVIDEAYGEFAEYNAIPLLKTHKNIVITRTFSKYYGLAGIRFGMAIADPTLIHELLKVKDSYNCDALSLAAAAAAIEDQTYYADLRSKIVATRGRLTIALSELGFEVTSSQANFVWCRWPNRELKPIQEELKNRKILVRYMKYPSYGEGLRITVGTTAEIEQFLKVLREII